MSRIKFSIIMPCFNSEAYVRNAIESIIEQDYDQWELIAVNDGSFDSTLEILNDYSLHDRRIRVFNKENGGYSSAVNLGLERLDSDYFLLLGSDDELFPHIFTNIVNEIDSLSIVSGEDPDIIAFRTIRFINGASIGIDQYTNFQTRAYLHDTTIKEFHSMFSDHSNIMFMRDTSKCFKTSLLADLRYFGKYGLDADGIFSSLFAHKSRSFLSIPIDGYHWTLRDNSVSAKTDLSKYIDRLSNWKQYFIATSSIEKDRVTEYDIKFAGFYYGIAQHVASLVEIDDFESMKEMKNYVDYIPTVFARLRLNNFSNRCEMFLMTHFIRTWIYYRKMLAKLQ